MLPNLKIFEGLIGIRKPKDNNPSNLPQNPALDFNNQLPYGNNAYSELCIIHHCIKELTLISDRNER